MKHIYSLLLILSYALSFVQGQVYTCKGGAIASHINAEFSNSDIANADSYTMSTYSYLGITFLDHSSNQYNCHAYAWHLREGNTNKVWIDNTTGFMSGGCYDQTHNIDRYWTDGCFVQVCNEADADKLHYYCGDHSAVRSTTNPGYYESKWGQLAVVRHTKTGVPYADPVNSVNYYASTRISGDQSNLCPGTRVFSVKSISGASYTWTSSASVSIVSGGNTNQVTVQRNGNANDDAGWVQVQVSTPCSAAPSTQTAYFTVGARPPSDIVGMDPSVYFAAGQYVTLTVYDYAVSYNWYIAGGTVIGSTTGASVYVKLDNCFPGQNAMNDFDATLSIDNGCGVGLPLHEHTYAPCTGGIDPDPGFTMTVSPNPATDDLHATMNVTQMLQSKQLDKTDKITARLYDLSRGGFVKQWTLTNGQNQHLLSLSGVRKGQYILEVVAGKKKITKQITVQ